MDKIDIELFLTDKTVRKCFIRKIKYYLSGDEKYNANRKSLNSYYFIK